MSHGERCFACKNDIVGAIYKCTACWESRHLCQFCYDNGATCPFKAGKMFSGPAELKGHRFKSRDHPGDDWRTLPPRDEAQYSDFTERHAISKSVALAAAKHVVTQDPSAYAKPAVLGAKYFGGKVFGDSSKQVVEDAIDFAAEGPEAMVKGKVEGKVVPRDLQRLRSSVEQAKEWMDLI